jgi:hypothetical protein
MGVLQIIYYTLAGIICLLALWCLFREKILFRAICIGILSIPFILRVLMIK